MKKIFLTGASSGIGLAIAHALLARGDDVWGTSRNLIRLENLKGVHPVRLDLNDPRSIDDAFKSALAEAGYFDVVINNAGGGHFGPAEHSRGEYTVNERPNANRYRAIFKPGQCQTR